MRELQLGDLVVILGKLDNRVRDRDESVLVVGTLDQVLSDYQVSVLLENGDIWVGPEKCVRLASEQV